MCLVQPQEPVECHSEKFQSHKSFRSSSDATSPYSVGTGGAGLVPPTKLPERLCTYAHIVYHPTPPLPFLGVPKSVTIFVTISHHTRHIQCNAMQIRVATYRRLDRQNPAFYEGIECMCSQQGLVFVNRRLEIRFLSPARPAITFPAMAPSTSPHFLSHRVSLEA